MDRQNQGAFRQAEGSLREAANKLASDAKGMANRQVTKAQNTMGGMKDSLRDANRKDPRSGRF